MNYQLFQNHIFQMYFVITKENICIVIHLNQNIFIRLY